MMNLGNPLLDPPIAWAVTVTGLAAFAIVVRVSRAAAARCRAQSHRNRQR